MTTVTFHCGDIRDIQATLPDYSIDCLITSPPFLALRSYLPADHPDKHREIGSEPTPAAFIDTLLALTADWRRLLTPTGSLAVELGDTYSGSGGGGGDYLPGGMRENQPGFGGSAERQREGNAAHWRQKNQDPAGWPLAKSLCCLPALYETALAYAINPLTGQPSPAGRWRVRNWLTWTRPNPPVGALGDKVRPATSYVTVGCTSDKRWFDLDSVRTGEYAHPERIGKPINNGQGDTYSDGVRSTWSNQPGFMVEDRGGAPPLDWWDTTDNTWQPLHRLPTPPYKGAHYATFPIALPERLIKAMCPREVCTVCGEPRRRITAITYDTLTGRSGTKRDAAEPDGSTRGINGGPRLATHVETLGWTDCDCEDIERYATPEEVDNGCELGISYDSHYRPGHVLDPFAGSGTTLVAAALNGRDATGIDIDHRNVALCRQRLTETMRVHREIAGNPRPRTTQEGRGGRTPIRAHHRGYVIPDPLSIRPIATTWTWIVDGSTKPAPKPKLAPTNQLTLAL